MKIYFLAFVSMISLSLLSGCASTGPYNASNKPLAGSQFNNQNNAATTAGKMISPVVQ